MPAIILGVDLLHSLRIATSGLEFLHGAVTRQAGDVNESARDSGVERLQEVALQDISAGRSQAPVRVQHAQQQHAQRLRSSIWNVDGAVAKRVPLVAIFGRGRLLNEL